MTFRMVSTGICASNISRHVMGCDIGVCCDVAECDNDVEDNDDVIGIDDDDDDNDDDDNDVTVAVCEGIFRNRFGR